MMPYLGKECINAISPLIPDPLPIETERVHKCYLPVDPLVVHVIRVFVLVKVHPKSLSKRGLAGGTLVYLYHSVSTPGEWSFPHRHSRNLKIPHRRLLSRSSPSRVSSR